MRFSEGRGVPSTRRPTGMSSRRAKAYRYARHARKGQGVKKDLEVARKFYVAAAGKGPTHNLAVLYAEGIDGKPDSAATPHNGSARPPSMALPTASTIWACWPRAASAWIATLPYPTNGSRWRQPRATRTLAASATRSRRNWMARHCGAEQAVKSYNAAQAQWRRSRSPHRRGGWDRTLSSPGKALRGRPAS